MGALLASKVRNYLMPLQGFLQASSYSCAGFQNIATAELCARWVSVGAWQPFARDHHAQSFQELYRSAYSHLCIPSNSTPATKA